MPKKKPTHEDFESIAPHGKFTKIVDNMQDSKAWQTLEPSQMGLYLLFKRKFTKYRTQDDNCKNISFPHSEYKQIKTYSNKRVFWRDLDALIDRGFIRVVASGKISRTASIYGFSDMWKKFGTNDFIVYSNERRATE